MVVVLLFLCLEIRFRHADGALLLRAHGEHLCSRSAAEIAGPDSHNGGFDIVNGSFEPFCLFA